MDGMSGYWELADALESDSAAKSAQRRAVVSRVDDDGTVYGQSTCRCTAAR